MARKLRIKEPIAITVTISTEYHNHLKKVLVRLAMQQGKPVTLSEAIRALLEQVYPMPKTIDMFEEQENENAKRGRKPNGSSTERGSQSTRANIERQTDFLSKK